MYLVYRALEGESVPMSLPPPLVPPSKRKKPSVPPVMPLLPSPPSVKDSRSSHAGSKTMPHPPKPTPAPVPSPAVVSVSTRPIIPPSAGPVELLGVSFQHQSPTKRIYVEFKVAGYMYFSKAQNETGPEGREMFRYLMSMNVSFQIHSKVRL